MSWTARYILLLLTVLPIATFPHFSEAQHEPSHAGPHDPQSVESHQAALQDAHHHTSPHASPGWEGSAAGIAYSERNHHIAGIMVLLIGFAELNHALRLYASQWPKLLLPAAMTGMGLFLLIWSDHDAWPIGSLSFSQTVFSSDTEIIQHKAYGLLLFAVGTIEWIRRRRSSWHAAWSAPLPLLALVGGLMLFGHSHGEHPSAHKITLHHAVMGTIAMTAGSSKLLGGWLRSRNQTTASTWEIVWAVLIVTIGVQLLLYSE
ncbi:MAG TPA: hypothetical protein VFS39_11740 [Nitrospira sp.]|nr:hypothetical protein [Nitrospira sp.]